MNIIFFKKRFLPAALTSLAFLLAACAVQAGDTFPRSSIRFSDGSQVDGVLRTPPDTKLSIDAGGIKEFRLSEVAEIAMAPEKEEVVREWRFKEAGKPEKEFYGEPYPVRYLKAVICLVDGRTFKGTLRTILLDFLDESGKKRKVILLSKQRGDAGSTLEALAYPASVKLSWPGASGKAALQVKVSAKFLAGMKELVVIGKPGLLQLESASAGVDGIFRLKGDRGEGVVAALKTPDGIVVAWPSTLDDKGLVDKITAALADQRDFFDRKKILAVGGGAGKGELYTLILLERGGETTLEGPDTSPWRLEVWRWSGDAEEGKFALAGRGCLFRGIGATDVKPPPVTLDVGVVAVE